LHGNLHLWQRKLTNQYIEIDVCQSAAELLPYQLLKSLAHIAVTINTLLPAADNAIALNTLKLLHKQVCGLLQSDDPVILPHHPFLQLSRDVTARAADSNQTLLANYNQAVKSTLDSYGAQAADMQLASLNHTMLKWQRSHALQLDQTRIMIVSAHGPRQDLLERQFFDHYLQQNQCTQQGIIYTVEMLPTQMGSINIPNDLIHGFLSKQELNKMLGKTLLDDETAMLKDVLGKHAHVRLFQPVSNSTANNKESCPFLNFL
jgi:hypothetical protein